MQIIMVFEVRKEYNYLVLKGQCTLMCIKLKAMIKTLRRKKLLRYFFITDIALMIVAICVMLSFSEPAPVKGLRVEKSTFSSATLKWNASPNVGAYRIFRSENGGEYEYIGSTIKNVYSDTNLKTGTEYDYAVAARNGIRRGKLIKSAAVNVTPSLEAPSISIDTSKGNVDISISAVDGASVYEVFRDNLSIGQCKGSEFIDEKAIPDQTHKYEVKAVRYEKKPVYSKESNTVEAELYGVKNLAVEADDNNLIFNWDSNDHYDTFKLYNGQELLEETYGTDYILSGYDKEKVYNIRLVGVNSETEIQSPENKKSLKVVEEPMDNQGAIDAACDWAVEISEDDSFAYGTGNTAHRCGCYFCGTNRSKKGPGYEKTYCCNPFVHAAYAHGAGDPQMLRTCQNGDSVGMNSSDYTRYGNWEKVGRPSISELERGDVLVGEGHVMLYIGDGMLVHAKQEGWGPGTITTDKCSGFYDMVNFVMRYTGSGSGTMCKVKFVNEESGASQSGAADTQENTEEGTQEDTQETT